MKDEQERILKKICLSSGEQKKELIDNSIDKFSPLVNYALGLLGITDLDEEDLLLEANLILAKCLNTYDSDKGIVFSTYLIHSILKCISDNTDRYRWNKKLYRRLKKIKKAIDFLENKLGRPPTIKEVSERVKFSEATISATYNKETQSIIRPMSLQAKVHEYDNTLVEQIVSPENLEENVLNKLDHEELVKVIDNLTPMQQDIIYMIADGYTRKEIQDKYNLTVGQVDRVIQNIRKEIKNNYECI